MRRKTDPAAHDDAVDQRDIRLLVPLDDAVEPIFLAPEDQCLLEATVLSDIVELPDIAAGAERLAARALDHHQLDRRVGRPRDKLGRQNADHAYGHGVQRFWPVECDEADDAALFKQDLVG